MGVPGFFSWLIRRYPLVKHLIQKQQVPSIDYLYLDMNGIIYKCVKDDSIIFKSQLVPKEMQEIWLDVFNYINMLVNILKPNKMIVLGLDGAAPRAKMNNQRSRRFKSARDYQKYMEKLSGFTGENQSSQNFKNNSISPGTAFMEQLGNNLQFFIKKKIEQDDYWKSLSIIFTSSSSPGEGQHKIMQFIRANSQNFSPQDSHCLYGADADLIMLSMTLPLKNLCIIREEFVPGDDKVKIADTKKEKIINFQMIFVTVLREYFQIEYQELKAEMKVEYNLEKIIKDFVFLFFFIGNDFLPRCYAYNIRASSIQDLIDAFKEFLRTTEEYVVGPEKLNMKALTLLANAIASRQGKFIGQKAEDIQKIPQKEQFTAQLNQLLKVKAVKQQQFILQLKTLYMNDQNKTRSLYYGQYFKIDPAENPAQFYQILNFYLYGLQFVYEYYFINLPSWEWYYPYYCSPLVSDLFFYLNYLTENGQELPKLEPGAPFAPFRQLLCILPKESNQLLPEPFRNYLLEKDSILRAPVDYYPDKFEEEPYGALKEHQYIALIPFLDINLIDKVYNQAIKHVSEKQLKRNTLRPSTLFQYDKNAKEIFIESKFKSIPTVTCTITETPINLRDNIKWGKNTPKIKDPEANLVKMPSLKVKNFFSTQEKDNRKRKYYIVQLKNQQQIFKVGQEVFYGYPLQKSGKIEAILNPEGFITTKDFSGYDNYTYKIKDINDGEILNKNPKLAFSIVKNYLMGESRYEFNWSQIQSLAFVKGTQQFVRCLDGSFKRVYQGAEETHYEIVPSPLISKTKIYQNTMDKKVFQSLEEEFGLGENVLVFPQAGKGDKANQLFIQKGKVVGYTENKVKVQLGQKIKQVDQKRLQNIVHTRQIYFTLKFCAFILEINQDVLLTLLESINIELNDPSMPPSIDIGLNFICRFEEKLVPNLVRINFEHIEDRSNVQKLFRNLDISLKGLQLIIEYKKQFPHIFEFIEKRFENLKNNKDKNGKINWREKIRLEDIYEDRTQEQHTQDLKSLMSIYVWLVTHEQTHMPLSSIYSKQISVKNIKKLQQQFVHQSQQQKKKKHKYGDPIITPIDPNFLFSRRLATYGKMHLAKSPISSTIRDQVVCLHPEFYGQLGVIIGFDYNKFQVMFSRPSFGKSDLNGICNDLWAGKFYERDLFNFQTWPEVMRTRYATKNMAENIGWDGYQTEIKIIPKFKEKALTQFADIQRLAEKGIFTQQFLKYIDEVKKNRKIEKLDEDFQVVDNRRGDYMYKYDKGKTTLEKQYVEKIVKDKKYIEKLIEPSIKQEYVEKQIIENKALNESENKPEKNEKKEQIQEPTTKVPEDIDDEDDGDDMLK